MGIEDKTEGDAFGNKDWTQNEDRDGFNVGEPTPFLPTINYAYFDKDDHEGDPPLAPDGEEWQDGDATGYLVEFNQAYIYNRVSSSQLQEPRRQDIENMQKIHTLDFEDDLHYFVKVQISSKNFLITEALFTGVEKPYEDPTPEGEEPDPHDDRPFTTQFPHIIFEEYDTGHDCYTGYYPICRIKNGHLKEYHQRDDIFVSDRQFEQRGYFVQGQSAHILKTGDGEVDASSGGPHYRSETYPVNVRAIRAGSGVKVYQRENYIEIEASGAGASGDWSGECIGYEGEEPYGYPDSKGCCVYNEYTLMPSEFHTIYGNVGAAEKSNITTLYGNADGQVGGNNDTILIESHFTNCGDDEGSDQDGLIKIYFLAMLVSED